MPCDVTSAVRFVGRGDLGFGGGWGRGVGMKEGRKCGGRDGAGRRWRGGTESQRWLLAPAPLARLLAGPTAACGARAAAGAGGPSRGPVLGTGEGSQEQEETGFPGMG